MTQAETTPAPPTAPAPVPVPAAGHRWSPVLAVALATFTVVSSEMMPVGLLTPMSDSLGVSAGTTGLTLTITGLMVLATIDSPSWTVAAPVG
ncbi:hypothetical protein [Kitasatospora sp. NPDC094011]|uniref:hypothetical protein n=1 Tax=Kitasatospora sp. NPDC094011 TaxID=3364090 RepID=UPI0038024930